MDHALVTEHLRKAERHVAEGERHIARQRELIVELGQRGHDTQMAIDLLNTFERTQAMHISELDRVRAELNESAAPAKSRS